MRNFFRILGVFVSICASAQASEDLERCLGRSIENSFSSPTLPARIPASSDVAVEQKTSFAYIGDGAVVKSVLSSDGQRVASVVAGPEGGHKVIVQDVNTSAVLSYRMYRDVDFVQFVPDSRLLAVNAVPGGSKIRRSQLIPIPDVQSKSTLLPAKASSPNALSIVQSQLPAIAKSDYLDLEGTRDRGTDVRQVLARADLPYVAVIQKSENTVRDVLRRDQTSGGSSYTTLYNRSTTLFDPKTGRSMGMLEYDGLVPIRGELNPRSTLAALWLTRPTAEPRPDSIVVVDMKNVGQVLSRYDFKHDSLRMRIGSHVSTVANRVRLSWSQDGRRLLVYEANTGTLADLDVASGDWRVSEHDGEDPWPIEGAMILKSGKNLVLRSRQVRNFGGAMELEGYVLAPHQVESSEPPAFRVDLNLTNDPILRKESHQFGAHTNPGRQMIEMKDGSKWVMAFPHHLLVVDSDPPHTPSMVSVLENKTYHRHSGYSTNRIDSIVQISDDTLRVSDDIHGVVDLHF